jgi:glycosyltransferase involved in cell wall biosynthesis
MTRKRLLEVTSELMGHTFAIPVYRAAPNLAALIESLRAQNGVRSEILLTSSTPSDELDAIARRYSVPLHINQQRLGIAADWNFALGAVKTEMVTLAHQDDLFAPDYSVRLAAALQRHPGATIAFCDYSEHTPIGARPTNLNLRIKRSLRRLAFGTRECITESRRKIRLLALGNPICCPSVMFNRGALLNFRFPTGLQTNLDWMAWLELARKPGGFVYVDERLVSKGIHAASETTATIANRTRAREDRAILDTLWPRPVAAALASLYKFGYRANQL